MKRNRALASVITIIASALFMCLMPTTCIAGEPSVAVSQEEDDGLADVSTPMVLYRSHVQNHGWRDWVCDGALSGTATTSLRLEAVAIKLGPNVSGGITYRAHCQDYGWMPWRANGDVSGTVGQSKRMEAIQIKLTAQAAKEYNVWYRVRCHTYGWMDWVANGATAGTTGERRRLEAIQIQVLKKDASPPKETRSLIYLDAGHGKSGPAGFDQGALARDGSDEASLTKELVSLIAKHARDAYGLTVYTNIDCNKNEQDRQKHAKSLGATALVSIHFGSANNALAHGFESFVFGEEGQYSGIAAPRSDGLQEIMHRHLRAALPKAYDRGMSSSVAPILNGENTDIPSTLLEVCFITNQSDYDTYVEHKDTVARELADALYEAYLQGF